MPDLKAHQFECKITWQADQPMFVGRSYQLLIGEHLRIATITVLKYKIAPGSQEQVAATKLSQGETAVCNISLDRAIPWPETDNDLDSFSLSDLQSERVSGKGTLHFALRRSQNIHPHTFDVDMAARAAQKQQTPLVLWFTGLSSSGKSTIANEVERQLYAMGKHSYLLDGDNVRHALNKDLGFTDADRVENIRRVAEVARLMMDSGLIVITAFISPFIAEREQAKQTIGSENFYEIFIDTPLAIAEQRDVKGLYKKARSGQLKNFTGIDSAYEEPVAPALVVGTEGVSPEVSAARVIEFLQAKGLL